MVPSGLKAVAMVERGGGWALQYIDEQWRSRSDSAQSLSSAPGLALGLHCRGGLPPDISRCRSNNTGLTSSGLCTKEQLSIDPTESQNISQTRKTWSKTPIAVSLCLPINK